ncbi:acyl-CoA dehydrogenase [Microbulbifer thermotolerans]|uniref:Acyl-coenzyme A dehydrogenase n=1 Tax=Microbulbifer thermotolerans TaxID=252514 RepID=A0A143HLW5_MICTH|nr:acyl-CoA dehydrogenase [Microbulbifer thermotolerans]AMX02521.1 acyl-CoA dehydrogenase [Microbulbifer thermotolerans]MCX2779378.1 acyl-CoA dehydrogenase [Microbulbifer thermotolerans]MCX2782418.1 acyl-CoA dehydrogenase [Microbulbifer thermotolerans]MCX2795003.1 acyl-CoA dehydrogenase [Microbulbifer thermotolerans]MCX2800571.1 acyl-CoA dehydrogenase [Microbulbifer thermotolerans]
MSDLRKKWITRPLLKLIKRVLPPISETEREAMEAGEVWWDAQLLSGKPDWEQLLGMGPPELSEEEQAFLDGPVEALCRMLDDWQISFEDRCIPAEIWDFLKREKFFGIIIPKSYGGLGFSPSAHAEIVTKISTRSTCVGVTVMVPNSLGPGELLIAHGTEAQKNYYLPRLADGREIPCFGLTSPEAGSDAASMVDSGVVCYGEYKGQKTLGMRVNWHKRYITLGPVATILGLAFKLYDPDHILGDKEALGITVALVPTDTEGVTIGQRHLPAMQAFQNGPNWGKDVFVPMEWVIGGRENVGRGWHMLMKALAAGRGISLPSLSTGGAKMAARTTGAYARIREQFGIPIGKFEGVQRRLAEIAGIAYVLDSAHKTTTRALDEGLKPAVVSAIMKAHATQGLRQSINDAMDIHAGKAIMDGPLNYIGNVYRAVPVAITVEGANILTRSLMIFGQGAIRCHPYLFEEMLAAENPDSEAGVEVLDRLLPKHFWFQVKTFARAVLHGWTVGLFATSPKGVGKAAKYYRQLNRYSAVLTLVTEFSLMSLGGELKRKELISARLGDVLSELYLLSCTLKRFKDDGSPRADRPLLEFAMRAGLHRIEERLLEVFQNFPHRFLGQLMHFLTMPWGHSINPASDRQARACAELLMAPSETRDRLTKGVFLGNPGDGVDLVEQAFIKVCATQSIRDKLKKGGIRTLNHAAIDEGIQKALISEEEAEQLRETADAVNLAIQVDHFDKLGSESAAH